MSENVPAPQDDAQVPAVQSQGGAIAEAQSVIDDTTSGAGFLPYLQLFTAKSTACTEGKIPVGHWGLVRDGEIEDLTNEVIVQVCYARPRAYRKTDDGNIIVVHDKDSDEYAEIAALQRNKVTGCMVGPEVLVFVEAAGEFASFFCGSPTLRREAKKFKAIMGKAARMKSKIIDNGQYKWHGPSITPYTAGLDPCPSPEEIAEQVEIFKNPPKPKVERADDDPDDDVDR